MCLLLIFRKIMVQNFYGCFWLEKFKNFVKDIVKRCVTRFELEIFDLIKWHSDKVMFTWFLKSRKIYTAKMMERVLVYLSNKLPTTFSVFNKQQTFYACQIYLKWVYLQPLKALRSHPNETNIWKIYLFKTLNLTSHKKNQRCRVS